MNVLTPAEGHAIRPFDNAALYAALDEKRTALGLSRPRVADQMWEQSAALNGRRSGSPDQPVHPDQRDPQSADIVPARVVHAALARPCPGEFPPRSGRIREQFNLPAAGEDHRLRWALKLLYVALDEKRREEGLTWIALAAALGCSPGQLTGLRTAKYATTMDLSMRSPSGSAARRPTSSTRQAR